MKHRRRAAISFRSSGLPRLLSGVGAIVLRRSRLAAARFRGMLAEGEAIPEPSTREQVLANPEYRGGKPVWVPLNTDAWIGRAAPPRS